MLGDLSNRRLDFFNQPTDMRKGFNGLSGLVNQLMDTNLLSGDIFVFLNKSKDKIKLLAWERNGFAIYYKQLEKGTFEWPTAKAEKIQIKYEELFCMFEGIELQSVKRRVRYELPV